MISISVCMIAKNEENHIEECLKRLRPCKFEIIVVDTGSTDKTVEIAKKYTDNVYSFTWCDDFSAARNYSISKASNDWILVIDCDEYLENVNLEKIQFAMEEHPEQVGLIARNNPYTLQGVRSVMSERIGRFFNRNHCHYEGVIHEQVVDQDGKEPSTYDLPLTLYHEGYVSESEKRTRATRNLEMLLQDLESRGENPYVYFQMGQNYLSLNDVEKAAHYYELGLQMNVDLQAAYVQSMIETYGYCLMELNRYEESLAWITQYKDVATHADFAYLAGMIYIKNKMWGEAIEALLHATSIPSYSRKGVNSYLALFHVGLIYEKLGQLDLAKSYYYQCGSFDSAAKRLEEIA